MKKYLCIVPLVLLAACDRTVQSPQERVVVVQQPVERVVVVERPVERVVERPVVVERPSIVLLPRMERQRPCDAPRVHVASGTISWLGADWSGSCIENVKFSIRDDRHCDSGRIFSGSPRCLPLLKCIHDEYQRGCGIRVRVTYSIDECGEPRIISISRC